MTDNNAIPERAGCVLFLHCQTGVPAGAGSVLGHVDLPIQREVHTGHPVIYGSGVKGALREAFGQLGNQSWVEAFFGSEPPASEPTAAPAPAEPATSKPAALPGSRAGCAIFQEARVLFFPVRSFKGVFVWITCPDEWRRFRDNSRDDIANLPGIHNPRSEDYALFGPVLAVKGDLFLEDYKLSPESDESFAEWRRKVAEVVMGGAEAVMEGEDSHEYWKDALTPRIVILSNQIFSSIVRTRTQIETHVKVEYNGIVKTGPWNVDPFRKWGIERQNR